MPRMWSIAAALSLALALGWPAVAGAQGQGKDELWEVTSKMEMAGMPMQMPARTQQVCRPAGQSRDEALVPKDQNCRMTEMKQSGNTTTFTMVCEGKDKITGTGQITSTRDSYQGAMRMTGTMDGRPVNMNQTFSGKRLGACTYEDPRKAADAMMAAQCDQAVEQMSTAMFTMEQSPCKHRKADFCGRVSQLAQEMRTPDGYRAAVRKHGDWSQKLAACGQDPAAVTAGACTGAVRAKQYDFVADSCDADAKALAAEYCEGRDYTTAMSSEYAPICRRYAAARGERLRPAPSTQPAAPSASPAAPAPEPGVGDKIKEGTDTLRRFLRW